MSGRVRTLLSNLANLRLPGSSQAYADALEGITNTSPIPKPAYTPPPGGTAAERAEAIRRERESAAQAIKILNYNANNPTMDKDYPFSSIYDFPNAGYPDKPIEVGGNGNIPDDVPVDKTPVDIRPREDEKPGKYSDEGLALSAEFFGALAARRRAADEALQMSMEQEKTQTERLNLAATTARTQLTREFRNLSEDMMRMLAGRGTARAPMVAGRGARRLQTAKDERFGQISQTLADEVSALGQMVQMAESAQRAELARIAQDEALAKTQPAGLLPASAAFGG